MLAKKKSLYTANTYIQALDANYCQVLVELLHDQLILCMHTFAISFRA